VCVGGGERERNEVQKRRGSEREERKESSPKAQPQKQIIPHTASSAAPPLNESRTLSFLTTACCFSIFSAICADSFRAIGALVFAFAWCPYKSTRKARKRLLL
jgi:hypothetical protein